MSSIDIPVGVESPFIVDVTPKQLERIFHGAGSAASSSEVQVFYAKPFDLAQVVQDIDPATRAVVFNILPPNSVR